MFSFLCQQQSIAGRGLLALLVGGYPCPHGGIKQKVIGQEKVEAYTHCVGAECNSAPAKPIFFQKFDCHENAPYAEGAFFRGGIEMWKKAFPCRCRKCGHRHSFSSHPETYLRAPKCSCGGAYRVDTYRMTTEHKKVLCWCDGWWFPHRHGCSGCKERDNFLDIIKTAFLEEDGIIMHTIPHRRDGEPSF